MVKEFYQEEAYLSLESKLLEGESLWYKFKNIEGGIPLIKRPIDGTDYFDTVSPYGYPGMVIENYRSDAIVEELRTFKEFCASENIVSTFLRMNPVYNDYMLEENEDMKHLIHGRVVTVPLKENYTTIQQGYSSNHRRGIKKLKKNGFIVQEEPLGSLPEFMDIYNETMNRLAASDYYFFPLEYYQKLASLDSDMKLIFARDSDGILASAALFMISDEVIQYHLGGTRDAYVRDSPNKLIFDYIINEYSAKKRYLVLGGGLNNREDSLFQFKYGFSKVTRKFSTVRMVHMKDQYFNLCKEYEMPKDEIMKFEGFFPLYRNSNKKQN